MERLISKERIKRIVQIWAEEYPEYKGVIIDKLRGLDDTATAADVARITETHAYAGPWTCDECGEDSEDVTDIGGCFLCRECLVKAARLVSSEWTTEPPQADGVYWVHQADGLEFVVEITNGKNDTGMAVEDMAADWNVTHWCGPIAPPPFPL